MIADCGYISQPIYFEDFVRLVAENKIKCARPVLQRCLDEQVRPLSFWGLRGLLMRSTIEYYVLYSGSDERNSQTICIEYLTSVDTPHTGQHRYYLVFVVGFSFKYCNHFFRFIDNGKSHSHRSGSTLCIRRP